jgi:hypothetical protein
MNPYELRATILQQAQDHLEKQYEANFKYLCDTFQSISKENFDAKKIIDDAVSNMSKYPTSDQIMAQATKFYSFVNQG